MKITTDRYKRLVGKVYLRDRYINAEMVADGAAWVYRKYSRDPELLELERQAREEGRGAMGAAGGSEGCALGVAAEAVTYQPKRSGARPSPGFAPG